MSLPEVPINRSEAPIEERVKYPDDWWNNFDNTYSAQQLEYWYMHRLGDADRVVISDDDCDGLTSVAMLRAAYPEDTIIHVESGHGSSGLSPSEAIQIVHDYSPKETEVYITDLCFEDNDFQSDLDHLQQLNGGQTVHLYDHHQWSDEALSELERWVDDLRIRDSESEAVEACATSITFEAVEADMRENNPEVVDRMRELANVVVDHDLWLKEDRRSDYLSTWAHLADDADEYIDTVLEFGADVISDPHAGAAIRAEVIEQEQRIEIVREKHTDWHEVRGADVAVAYGDAYRSELGERLLNEDGADIAVLIKPWDKVSIRTDGDEYGIAHVVAKRLADAEGGGHEHAAGCKPSLNVDYEEHWRTKGEGVKFRALETIEEVLQERAAAADDAV